MLATTNRRARLLGSALCVRLAFPAVGRTRRVSFTHVRSVGMQCRACVNTMGGGLSNVARVDSLMIATPSDEQQFQFTQDVGFTLTHLLLQSSALNTHRRLHIHLLHA